MYYCTYYLHIQIDLLDKQIIHILNILSTTEVLQSFPMLTPNQSHDVFVSNHKDQRDQKQKPKRMNSSFPL